MKKLYLSARAAFIVFLLFALMTGCLQRSKVPYLVDRLVLDYPPAGASVENTSREFIRIERFSIAQAYNTTAMVYRSQPFHLDTYDNSRWAIHPADMINDLLVRDLRSVGLFAETFSYQGDTPVRYVLDGFVEQFCASDDGPSRKAVFSVSIMLFDRQARDIPGRLRLHGTYRYSNELSGETAEALARSMTVNMENFSRDLTKALSAVIKQNN